MTVSAERLKEVLSYNAESGSFRWRCAKGRVGAGQIAGAIDAYGYRVIRVDGRLYKAHRLAWLYAYGGWPCGLLDHINRMPGDNRLCNLREATQSENMHNANRRSKSGVPGVRWREERQRWVAQIRIGYRNYVLGSFTSKDAAIEARRCAEQTMFSSIHKGASDE
jgi:hypothetical protein